jgi:EAL domain-containing protein (putative c-di-GMP-specific phosphodiesterase class I)
MVELGCRRAQGHLFSRPTGAAEIARLLAAGGLLGAPDDARVPV